MRPTQTDTKSQGKINVSHSNAAWVSAVREGGLQENDATAVVPESSLLRADAEEDGVAVDEGNAGSVEIVVGAFFNELVFDVG